ncbi:MAG: DUF4252 domain-containing protein [Paramuribaculum sp.]|nr:DUF4252 domain-containing protein [Paramuribaculum sp.]
MKRLLTSLIFIVSCVAVSFATEFDNYMNLLVRQNVVSEIHVSKAMVSMLSPEVRKKIPLLGKVPEINSVSIYTASDEDAVNKCARAVHNSFMLYNNKMRARHHKLLEIKDDKGYTAVYAMENEKNSGIYDLVVLLTDDGTKGQVIAFEGEITPEVLSLIAKSVPK